MSVEGIYLAGIGGQGIVTLAKLIAANLEQRGFKTSLLHATGMAQRGGRVTSEIRFSDDSKANFAPRISGNEADILISMENGEGISSLRFLKDNGLAILLDYSLVPAEIILKKGEYPGLTEAVGFFLAGLSESSGWKKLPIRRISLFSVYSLKLRAMRKWMRP